LKDLLTECAKARTSDSLVKTGSEMEVRAPRIKTDKAWRGVREEGGTYYPETSRHQDAGPVSDNGHG